MSEITTEQQTTASIENTQTPIRVGITQGDTNGVGIEVILKTFDDAEMLTTCIPVVYGHLKVFNYHRKVLGSQLPLVPISSAEEAVSGQLNFINLGEEEIHVNFGLQSEEAGHAAFLSLEQCVQDAKAGRIDAMLTAPINKASIQRTNFRFAGHTEYLQDRFSESSPCEPLMILCNELMRVALVTTHLPIAEISYAITEERITQKARLLYESLQRDFCISAPRIAVLALNPHAGDGGVLGHEEADIIEPAVHALSDAGLSCYGPYAADGFFGSGAYRHFDGILAMYHDQGLAPFKALCVDGGVNFTAGLPVVRTSPDHGTAYNIAGKGVARPDSFRHALFAAIDIVKHRAAYDEAHKNPLEKLFICHRERN